MALSVYVHIPYCLQRCRYCDFTTFEQSEILPPDKYTKWVLNEIRTRHHIWPEREIGTLYFGGGTPSLIAPELIVSIVNELANAGFRFLPDCEQTLEINPATLTSKSLEQYLKAGFNRFSVGAQTFNERLLQLCGRKHNASDTRQTLKMLRNQDLNYSFDLLFALPTQNIGELETDLFEVLEWNPPHLSAYCLTVPESHPMAQNRAPENEQVEMFGLIEKKLLERDIRKYEISNFAKVGFESRHNLAYWTNRPYWGIGLSAHSYDPMLNLRFWNPKSLELYGAQSSQLGESFATVLPPDQWEKLHTHEALTDFCHMHLRIMSGLSEVALRNNFDDPILNPLWPRLRALTEQNLLLFNEGHWRLTPSGCLISNFVFEKLTFSKDELSTLTCPH